MKKLKCQSERDLEKKILKIKVKLGLESEEKLNAIKYSLVDKRDEDLTKEEKRKKRFQVMLKKNEEKRKVKREKRKVEKQRIESMIESDPNMYLTELLHERKIYKKKIKKIKKFKEDNLLQR